MTAPSVVPTPPLDMTTPATPQIVALAAIGAVVAVMVIGGLYLWRRTGRPEGLLVLAGGFFCCFNEAPADVFGQCYFPHGSLALYSMFDRPIPVWVVLAYVGFFGGLTYINVLLFRRGLSRRGMWISVGAVLVINLILEMPLLASNLYLYYGPQPFMIGGFPLNWLVINSLGSMVASVVIVRLSWFFTGPRMLLLVAVPYATYMASWVLAMPYFGTMNADVSGLTRSIAALISIALGLYVIDVLIRLGVQRSSAPTAGTTAVPRRETVTPVVEPDKQPAS